MEDDGDDKDDSKRRTRNLSEKKRRDQFNMLVNELSSMISTNNRKMDKSTVLKSTISFLKNHNEVTVRSRVHDVQEDWKPLFLSNEEFTYLILEALEGFIMVFSATGFIYYVSEGISSLLGHNPNDMINKSIFELCYEDDRHHLYSLLQNPGAVSDPLQPANPDNEIKFKCHLRRGSHDFRDEISYELVQFCGHFRTNTEHMGNGDIGYRPDHESRLLFVCTGRLYTPQLIRDVTLVDTNRSEFTSRHSLEWKFLFLDHRAPPIIGYLPFEVLGTSGYDYYHFDDLEKVVTCHEALMQKGELTSCYYRFLTKGQQWIWLQSRFYITYHQWNSKPEFVVCTHRVVSHDDVVKSFKEEGTEVDTASEVEMNRSAIQDVPLSPSYMSEASDAFGASFTLSQPSSVKSGSCSTAGTVGTAGTAGTAGTCVSTAAPVWPRVTHATFAATGSDTASLSGDSRSSLRHDCREMKPVESALVPQHGIGAQYLDPAPYVNASAVQAVPVQNMAIAVTQDQGQTQVVPQSNISAKDDNCDEQLQRKHEELQQMIVRQQEELRQVKEQLLLARLGILQPIIAVPPYDQEMSGAHLPAQITYEPNDMNSHSTQNNYNRGNHGNGLGYPQQPPNNEPWHPHMPQ